MNRYKSIHFRDGSVMLFIPGYGWKVFSRERKEMLVRVLKELSE